ncbi:MAG TPA: hypothetical protein VK453_25770 [Micromonosporaceae bacterium]|nr:hypothetical protein [Micromonosporaceae bacterium]
MPRPHALMPTRIGNGKAVHLGELAARPAVGAEPRYNAACLRAGRGHGTGAATVERITCCHCIHGFGLVIPVAHENAGLSCASA